MVDIQSQTIWAKNIDASKIFSMLPAMFLYFIKLFISYLLNGYKLKLVNTLSQPSI